MQIEEDWEVCGVPNIRRKGHDWNLAWIIEPFLKFSSRSVISSEWAFPPAMQIVTHACLLILCLAGLEAIFLLLLIGSLFICLCPFFLLRFLWFPPFDHFLTSFLLTAVWWELEFKVILASSHTRQFTFHQPQFPHVMSFYSGLVECYIYAPFPLFLTSLGEYNCHTEHCNDSVPARVSCLWFSMALGGEEGASNTYFFHMPMGWLVQTCQSMVGNRRNGEDK